MANELDAGAWGVSRILLVAPEGEETMQIRSAMTEALGRSAVIERCAHDRIDPQRLERCDLIIVAQLPEVEASSWLKPFSQLEPRRPFVVLLSDSSRNAIQEVMRAGADEVLFQPLRAGELTRALIRVFESRKASQRAKGTVCTFNSLTGGAGVTTLALGFATAVHQTLGRSTVLVDLDPQSAGVSGALEIEAEQTMADLSQASKLDSIELEAALTRHSSGLYILAAPRHIDDHEAITPEIMANVLGIMRQIFDFVVIDGARHIDERMVAVWENSDRLLYVLNQSVSSVRSFLRLMELLRRLEVKAPHPQLILNRSRRALAITPDQISSTVEQPILFQVPADDKAAATFNSEGDRWSAIAKSTLPGYFEKLARLVSGIDREPAGRFRFLTLPRFARGNA